MFVKLDDGLTQPFVTTIGLKQGCIFSPLLFNLFVNNPPLSMTGLPGDQPCPLPHVGG